MPRNDQTGPNGKGPMTGRRMGVCVGNQKQESTFRFRRGFSSRQNMGGASFNKHAGSFQKNQNSNMSNKEFIESEIENLKNRLQLLEDELNNLS